MATRGRRTAILTGACGLAVLAGAVATYWDDVEVERLVRQLHSEDASSRETAARALARFGAPVTPRLLDELEAVENQSGQIASPFPDGFCSTIVAIGTSTLPHLIERLDSPCKAFFDHLAIAMTTCYVADGLPRDSYVADRESADEFVRGVVSATRRYALEEVSAGRGLALVSMMLTGIKGNTRETPRTRFAASAMLKKLNAGQAAGNAQ